MEQALLFALMIFFGFMATEGVVEFVLGTAFDKVVQLAPFKWLLMYVSLAVGIFLAFYYSLDAVALVFQQPPTPVGLILTGTIMGRGANFVSDIWQRFLLGNAQRRLAVDDTAAGIRQLAYEEAYERGWNDSEAAGVIIAEASVPTTNPDAGKNYS